MTGASGLIIEAMVLMADIIHIPIVANGFRTETMGLKKGSVV